MKAGMKDSGAEWIGMIPDNWETGKIGQLYKERREKVSDEDFPPLSVTMKGIVPQLSSAAKSDDHNNRKKVCKGDFAINSRSDRRGSCGISEYEGSVSLINTVLAPRKSMDPRYYNWVFHTSKFSDEYFKWGHGIVDDLWTTGWQDMKRIIIPVPSPAEQEKIADFLEEQCTEIDKLYNSTQESIDEYKKIRQIIISNAVTKGILEHSYKECNSEWLDELPDGWEIERLKYYFDFGKGLPITKEDLLEEGVAVISYGQIHAKSNSGVSVSDDLLRYVNDSFLESNPSSLVEKGNFIFADTSEDLAGCGNCVYVDVDYPLFAGYHSIILRPREKRDNKYLAYLFQSDLWRKQIRSRVAGIKLYSVTQKILKETTIVLPGAKEQELIVKHLDEKCARIDTIIACREQLIKELDIFKKTLIYDCVTGKRKVV